MTNLSKIPRFVIWITFRAPKLAQCGVATGLEWNQKSIGENKYMKLLCKLQSLCTKVRKIPEITISNTIYYWRAGGRIFMSAQTHDLAQAGDGFAVPLPMIS